MIWTYANQLTMLRMAFVPCFVILLVYGHPQFASWVFAIAALTDGLDGLLARKLQQKTELGSFLDPAADKLLVAAAFVTLSIPKIPSVVHIPIWLTITALSRDIIIALAVLIIHLHTGHSRFPPSWLGKCATTSQLLTVGAALLANLAPEFGMAIFFPAVYSTLLFTVASGLHYCIRSAKIIESYHIAKAGNDD